MKQKENRCHILKKMLIANDEDKLNSLKVKTNINLLEKNTIIYDFECATKGAYGHVPYFNHMIRLHENKQIEEKTFMHDVNLDTFNYILKIVNEQCDLYIKGKEQKQKSLMNKYKRPLTLCGFNSANYDLYFFINLLMKSQFSKRYVKNYF